jgi:hypothetical protein
MSTERIQGAALIAGAIALLATGLLHPTGGQLLASAEGFAHYATTNMLAHSLALLGVWLTTFGVAGVASRLGLRHPSVIAGLVAYGLAVALISMAAVVDGFVATRLAGDFVGTGIAGERDQLRLLMTFCFYVASSLSRVYVTGMAVALLLWSWAAWRTGFDRVLPWFGVAIATIALAAQLTGHLRMDVHDVMLLAVGQGAWLVWAGIALCRTRPATPAT